MTGAPFTPRQERLTLKEATGWFAAGEGFRKASTSLSDGAFKLFVYFCLEANRRTGRVEATHKELALALGKSKRSIGSHVDELEAQAFCNVHRGTNQYARSVFEIADSYWPYHRTEFCQESSEQQAYIESVRECFLALGCTTLTFGAAEAETARQMQQRAIPLAVIEDALLLGACRKYTSWLNGKALEPIRTLLYFEPLIAEIQEKPFPPGYSAYLRKKVKQLSKSWSEPPEACKTRSHGGYPDMASLKIVQ
jgi:hypothetical protein